MPTNKVKDVGTVAQEQYPIVGVGSSAGGLEAFIQLLTKMPGNSGMAFVLVQHLDPSHPSMSAEILSRATHLKVEEVKDGVRIQANHVYVIPPNHRMRINDGVLSLEDSEQGSRVKKTIDFFFHSLGISEKRRAIGVVLSGTGTDGTDGLRTIRSEGGVTFAQTPDSAKYSAMPQHAIDAGVIDLVMRPEEMANELLRMVKHPYLSEKKKGPVAIVEGSPKVGFSPLEQIQEESSTLRALRTIFSLILKSTKIDFSNYKPTTIKRRIHRRMMVHRIKRLEAYAEFLQSHEDEILALYNDLLINVTSFFRDPECYETLNRQVFPKIIKNKHTNSAIRVWVPGCSTGEEVYSIAISLLEFLGNVGKHMPIQIFGTDISESAIQRARMGQYSDIIAETMNPDRLKRFFDKFEGGYKIHKDVRDLCLFSQHDLTTDPPFAKLDLISCRNVLIYFSPVLQKRVLPIFHYALLPSGFLWLGKSENLGDQSRLFSAVEKSHKIYSKSNVASSIHFSFRAKHSRISTDTVIRAASYVKPESGIQQEADKILLAKFAPPSVVVNSDLEILQFRGRTVPFLEPASGQPSLNLLKMVRPELMVSLRSVIQAAKKENASVLKKNIHYELDAHVYTVDIEVTPINPSVLSKDRRYLVIFSSSSLVETIARGNGSNAKRSRSPKALSFKERQISELTKELAELKDYQQSIIDQYEATQEELTTANEELQSTNEELQSTNEEIETAKEELQSTNEELVTVNDELQIRNNDLTTLSSDLNNLFNSIDIPVLMVGRDHRIRRFSPKAQGAFNLNSADCNRLIGDIRPSFNANLDTLVSEVSETLRSKELELQDHNGVWFRLQVRPYRTIDNKIDGAVITLIDIDFLKQKELRTRESLEYMTAVSDTVPFPLVVVNAALQIQSTNRAFYDYFNQTKIEGVVDFESAIGLSNESLSLFQKAFALAIDETQPLRDLEVECKNSEDGQRKLRISGGKIRWMGAEEDALLLSLLDITEQRRLEEERKGLLSREQTARDLAEKANLAKDIFLATLSHELRTPLSPILTWSQLISQGKVDFERAKQGAAVIEQSAKAQNQLINDLLDISRIMAGKLLLNLNLINPGKDIVMAIESVRTLAEKKSIHINLKNQLTTELILADSVRLQQIVWNLLSNAIKFSPDNSVVEVTVDRVSTNQKDFVQIKVSDHGKGIRPEFLPDVFKQFSQADATSTRVHGGLGLGLSIVHNLVELHSGTVTVENASIGSGAIFSVRIPILKQPNQGSTCTGEQTADLKEPLGSGESRSNQSLKGLLVLLVEDDQRTREVTELTLRSFGAEVLVAESANQGMELLLKSKPNFLVCDIAMPIEDGYSLIRKIRGLAPDQGGQIPAMAFTAYATAEDQARTLAAGFEMHLAKPIEAEALKEGILKVWRHRK